MKISKVVAGGLIGLLMPVMSFAGSSATDSVFIDSGETSIVGSMNVRFDSSNDAIGMIVDASSVSVIGYDASAARSFYCYLTPTDALYNLAKDIAVSLTNGSSLYASSSTSGGKCTDVNVIIDSSYID